MELQGARVLVTGASKGIGVELARSFAAAGARVALAARSADALEALAAELGGSAHPVDLADPAQVDGFVDRVEADGGPIDVLVNNAGLETSKRIDRFDEREMSDMIAINLLAPQRLTRQVLPGMLARNRGHLVNVSSLAGVVVGPCASVYSSTKAGLTHFTHSIRLDLKGSDVGVTLVEPGPVWTEMWDRFLDEPNLAKVVKRAQRLQLYPGIAPEKLAAATVAAVAAGKPSVRFPKRLLLSYLLEDAPRKLTAVFAAGVQPQRS